MKKIIFVLFVLCVGASCSREPDVSSDPDANYPTVEKLGNAEAQKAFAKLLSKAVSNSVDVREFLKTEALARFDNDYDVFYPFVKDKEVCDGKTFRDILLSYCDREEDLVQIEESALLLDILIPDLTMFGDFDAENWDTGSDEIAVISRDDTDNMLYEDGEEIGALAANQIPAFPCLVVKNNERMVVRNATTRAATATYAFADDAYDPSKTGHQTRSSSYDQDLETPDSDIPYAKPDELDPSVITGWEEFGTDPTKAQRDTPYYGMTTTTTKFFPFLYNQISLLSDQIAHAEGPGIIGGGEVKMGKYLPYGELQNNIGEKIFAFRILAP